MSCIHIAIIVALLVAGFVGHHYAKPGNEAEKVEQMAKEGLALEGLNYSFED